MKAEELIIGDLVLYFGKVFSILKVDPETELSIIEDARHFKQANINDLSPISITPEILEKNGWKKDDRGYYKSYIFLNKNSFEGWVKEILNESNLPSKGYVLDYNLNIISAHLSTKIIEFPSIQVNTAKPFTYEYNYESEPYYSDETYKVTAKYVGDDKRYYDFKDLFISIDDAIEEKKKHFEVIDSLEFKEAIYNDFNNINFEEIKYTILKRLNG